MGEIAEKLAAIRIVAHVLNDRSAIGVGVGLAEIVGGRIGETLLEQGYDVRRPGGINDSFVGQHGVRVGANRKRKTHHQRGDDEK